MLLIEQKIQALQGRLPAWHFQRYSKNPGVQIIACFPGGEMNLNTWTALEAVASPIDVCGPLYTVPVSGVKI